MMPRVGKLTHFLILICRTREFEALLRFQFERLDFKKIAIYDFAKWYSQQESFVRPSKKVAQFHSLSPPSFRSLSEGPSFTPSLLLFVFCPRFCTAS
jgi:hypothetical protein